MTSTSDHRTLPLGLAGSLTPNFSVNAPSTAFLSSSGLAHLRSLLFKAPMTAPRLAQPVAVLEAR